MPVHNWHIKGDSAHIDLAAMVQTWLSWLVNVITITQLVAMVSTFNGEAVLDRLRQCAGKVDLPIRNESLLHEQQESMGRFLWECLDAKENVYSVGFKPQAHNACKTYFEDATRKPNVVRLLLADVRQVTRVLLESSTAFLESAPAYFF